MDEKMLEKYGLPTFEQFKEGMMEGESIKMYYQLVLDTTDHIPLKIFESFIENMATASIAETVGVVISFFKDVKVTYASVLTARKIAREEIAKLEN